MFHHRAARLFQNFVVHQVRRAERTTRVTRGRLNKIFFERRLLHDAAVHHG